MERAPEVDFRYILSMIERCGYLDYVPLALSNFFSFYLFSLLPFLFFSFVIWNLGFGVDRFGQSSGSIAAGGQGGVYDRPQGRQALVH